MMAKARCDKCKPSQAAVLAVNRLDDIETWYLLACGCQEAQLAVHDKFHSWLHLPPFWKREPSAVRSTGCRVANWNDKFLQLG